MHLKRKLQADPSKEIRHSELRGELGSYIYKERGFLIKQQKSEQECREWTGGDREETPRNASAASLMSKLQLDAAQRNRMRPT